MSKFIRYIKSILRIPMDLRRIESLLTSLHTVLTFNTLNPDILKQVYPQFKLDLSESSASNLAVLANAKYMKEFEKSCYKIKRDFVFNVTDTTFGMRNEAIRQLLSLASAPMCSPKDHLAILTRLRLLGVADQKLLEFCNQFSTTNASRSTAPENAIIWAICLGIWIRTKSKNRAKLVGILEMHQKLFAYRGLECDLEAANYAFNKGIRTPEIIAAQALYNHCKRNEDENFFSNYVADKKIAIVGNGPQGFGKKRGKFIDSNDIVVRFNHFVTSPKFADDYGTKVDVWAIAASQTPNLPDSFPSIRVILEPIGFRNQHFKPEKIAFFNACINSGKKVIMPPVDFYSRTMQQADFGHVTTGLLTIAWVKSINQNLSPDSLVGFSFEEGDAPDILSHYFESKNSRPGPHKAANERKFFENIFDI